MRDEIPVRASKERIHSGKFEEARNKYPQTILRRYVVLTRVETSSWNNFCVCYQILIESVVPIETKLPREKIPCSLRVLR